MFYTIPHKVISVSYSAASIVKDALSMLLARLCSNYSKIFGAIHDKSKYREIVVFQLAHLGDVVQTVSLLSYLQSKSKEALFTIVVRPEYEAFVRRFFNGRVLTLSTEKYSRSQSKDCGNFCFKKIKTCDVIYLARYDFRLLFKSLKFSLKNHKIVSVYGQFSSRQITLRGHLPLYINPEDGGLLHNVEVQARDLTVVDELNISDLQMLDSNLNNCAYEKKLESNSVVIHLTPPSQYRFWGNENIQNLLEYLVSREVKVYFIGDSNSVDLFSIEDLPSSVKNSSYFFDNRGNSSVSELIELIRGSSCYVGVDSGPLHVASFFTKTPIVALYGPQDPSIFSPIKDNRTIILYKSLHCSPCWQRTCAFENNRCMDFRVSDVVSAMKKVQSNLDI